MGMNTDRFRVRFGDRGAITGTSYTRPASETGRGQDTAERDLHLKSGSSAAARPSTRCGVPGWTRRGRTAPSRT